MSREITVILKNEKPAHKSIFSRVLTFVNDLIKSPLFGFAFGASIVTATPIIEKWKTPNEILKARQELEKSKEDAAIIAPFIANLDSSHPGKFEDKPSTNPNLFKQQVQCLNSVAGNSKEVVLRSRRGFVLWGWFVGRGVAMYRVRCRWLWLFR